MGPSLETNIHLRMLKKGRRKNPEQKLYGLHWGDPDVHPRLIKVRDRFVTPFINPAHSAIEIGPGGGRWTRYLLTFRKLYAVDFHQELLDELSLNFQGDNMVFIKNSGTDFPSIPESSIDYLFSFGVFVHLDIPLIEGYLRNMRAVLKPKANVVIQYSDKTKKGAQKNKNFSDNNPEIMRKLVGDMGYNIISEDTRLLYHSSIIHFSIT
jgi:ubiquinone/menaquinone biosynthesis C-methylase UbiE